MSDIKVMIVDDSAVVRQVLSDFVTSTPGMTVLDTAQDPVFAEKKIAAAKPDVIILDIEMPRMDGLTFLGKLMRENPIPVVMCSTLTYDASRSSMKALELGAVEVVPKPKANLKTGLKDIKHRIVEAIRSASQARLDRLRKPKAPPPTATLNTPEKHTADVILKQKSLSAVASTDVIAVGASTGGTQALEFILPRIKPTTVGIVIVQHMPEHFTAAFAERLNGLCAIEVREAKDGDPVQQGVALIAPGDRHMLLENRVGKMNVRLKSGPLVSRHRPSVDVLFRSVAQANAKNALGVILTGMGNDGAAGMLEMRNAGSATIAQDEKSCVIFGMPAAAIDTGAIQRTLSLEHVPTAMNSFKSNFRQTGT